MFYDRYSDRHNNVHVKLDGSTFSYDTNNIYDTNGDWDDTNDDGTIDKSASNVPSLYGIKNLTLGLHTFGDKNETAVAGDYNSWGAIEVGNPTHTSSHYQTFETPFLHELVGGDRNMEQTNLVVTPDGKTWDEVTRDMSYLGPRVEMHCARDGGHVSGGSIWFGDYWRGLTDGKDHYNKGIAIAYDRVIILEDGYYEVSYQNYHHNYDGVVTIVKNNTTGGVDNGRMLRNDAADVTQYGMRRWHCKRGDYITIKVDVGTNTADGSNVGYNEFRIIKIG